MDFYSREPSLSIKAHEIDELDRNVGRFSVEEPSFRFNDDDLERLEADMPTRLSNDMAINTPATHYTPPPVSSNPFFKRTGSPSPPHSDNGQWRRGEDPDTRAPTPPKSTPAEAKPHLQPKERHSYLIAVQDERERAVNEIKQLYERHIEILKATMRAGEEKYAALEAEYRKQLNRVQKDLDSMLHQQESVIRLKNEVERGLSSEISSLRADLQREKESKRGERETSAKRISHLTKAIEELRKELAIAKNQPSRLNDDSFSLADRPGWEHEKQSLVKAYEQRISNVQRQHDQKIGVLVRQFDREKEAALTILKTRIKSELNLILPKIKQQCIAQYSASLAKAKEETKLQCESQYKLLFRRLKQEHAIENELVARQARERYESDRQKWQAQLRAKYELKLMQIKNDCERQVIERLRRNRSREL